MTARDIEQQRLALECLKLAVSHGAGSTKQNVARAQAYFAFVVGGSATPAASPAETKAEAA